MIHNIVMDIIRIRYIRNPCNKCLVQPACKESCYKLKKYLESKETIYCALLAGLITANVLAWIKFVVEL
jgi:sulfatase maturation enzyme AslB (radical SAM superfamily)